MIRFDDILEKVSSSYSEKDVTLLKKAYVFAASAHKGQVRRSGEPYLSHPLEVTDMLAEMRLDHKALVAGLLHDILEDTDISAQELREAFGKEVADLVEGVTKISRVHETSPETRQAETIRKVILAMTDDLRVIFIKLADRLHNLMTLKFLDEGKQKQVARETIEIYAPIANRLGMGRIKAELEDHSFRYVDPEEYFRMASLVEPKKKKAEDDLAKLKAELDKLMRDNGIPAEIFHRIKRLYSIHQKMKRRHISFDQVYDFLALRLITDSVKNCYAALGIIHQKWHHLPNRFRDFIAMPKPNLYQALHTTIITEDKKTIEIQVRTHEMHTLAENGISAHWKYKEKDAQLLVREDKRLQWLREMVDLYKEQKDPREFLRNLKTDLIPEEVYVFTPKGEVLPLPAGASVLDFAFKVHSEIGLHCSGALVNGKLISIQAILKTGDIVEVLTSPDKIPQRSWLNIAITSTARHHIKRWLNAQEKAKSAVLGKRLWEKQAKSHRLPPELKKEDRLLGKLQKALPYRVRSLSDFYILLGRGKVILDKKFLGKIFLPPRKTAPTTLLPWKKGGPGGIKGKDRTGPLFHLAKCCSPIKGEPILGYITRGKGVTVHATRCPLISREILSRQRTMEVSWDSFPDATYHGKMRVEAEDSPGVLAKVASTIARVGGNITRAEVGTTGEKKGTILLRLAIRDMKHFEDIRNRLSRLKEITSVERL